MSDTKLVLHRLLNAPCEKVWRCLTEPDLLRQWFAPKPVEISDIALDLRPGGIFQFTMQVPDHGEMAQPAGCFLLIEPTRRLVWTSCLGPDFVPNTIAAGQFGMTADMRLTPEGDGCRYVATALHATPDDTRKHADMGFHDGWGTAATQLDDLAKTL